MRPRLLGSNTPAIASSSADSVTASSVADEMRRITPRDLTLLALLDSHRVFTTAQIGRLLFTSEYRAWHRCKTLYQRGLLDRFRRWAANGTGPYHWTVGPLGALVLAARNDTKAPRPAELRERRDRLAASPHLAHLIGVNGFFAELTAIARQRQDSDLITWVSERQASAMVASVIRPDGGALWREDGATVAFWLEYDNGTEDLSRLAQKLTGGYVHLKGSQVARPVLFWFASAIREANFIRHTGRASLAQLDVATASAEHASANGGPSGAVWSLAGDVVRVRLSELPSASHSESDLWGA